MTDMLLALKVLRKLGPKVMADYKSSTSEKPYYVYSYSNGREQGIAIIHDKGEKYEPDLGIFGNSKVVIFSEARSSDSLQVMVGLARDCQYYDFWKHAFRSGSEEMYKNTKHFEPDKIMTKGVSFIKKELGI